MSHKITFVTGIFDLGRESLGEAFRRPFQHYLNHFTNLLQLDIPLAIYIEKKYEDFVWKYRTPANTEVYIKEVDDFRCFPFYQEVEKIRTSESWRNQAEWLAESTQARLNYYNPLVMSKFFFLHDLTFFNPFDSEYFVWIDGGLSHTVDLSYLKNRKVIEALPELLEPFLFLCFPYVGSNEVHGFERKALATYCQTNYVNRVARGGFFGGSKAMIRKLNPVYYELLHDTLSRGLMGTEESIFSILSYKYEEVINNFMLESNGLVYKFFEDLSQEVDDIKSFKKNHFLNQKNQEVDLYVVSYNSPEQFQMLLESFEQADPALLSKTKKYLINNSTREETFEAYQNLCKQYGFEEIRKGNLGINGARQFAAEHFATTSAEYMIFFEDDMLLNPSGTSGTCSNGFSRYVDNLLKRSVDIMKKENFDFLKLSFTEFYGSNSTQWAWYNLPQDKRELFFPDNHQLPEAGLALNPPKTRFDAIQCHNGIPYTSGEIYYCNWPHIISKEGNKKMFLDTKWEHPYEQTWMSHFFMMTKNNQLRPGLLLASPINHNRVYHYPAEERREN
ncbi:MAG TPA: WlaTC/HtrL family glycosyltransferase [Cytophagaceae bacterium]